jgi:hypothetical protein
VVVIVVVVVEAVTFKSVPNLDLTREPPDELKRMLRA